MAVSVKYKRIVLTGTVPNVPRVDALKKLQDAGADVSNYGGITGQTDLVVSGQNPGPAKLAKASKLGVPVVSWFDVDFTGTSAAAGVAGAMPVAKPAPPKPAPPPKPEPQPGWSNDGKTFKVWRVKGKDTVTVELPVEPQPGLYTPAWNVPEVQGQLEMLFQVAMAIHEGESFLLTGPTGTGKTTVCHWLAKQLNWNLILMPINRGTEASHLVGDYLPVGDESSFKVEWTYGPVSQSVIASQTHPTLLLFDELNRIGNMAEFARVYSLMDGSKMLEMKEKRHNGATEVLRPGKLTICGTSNPIDDEGGDYIGTGQLDAALASRFIVQPKVDYPAPEIEAKALKERVEGLTQAQAVRMVAVANDIRKDENTRFPICFRELEAWARALRYYEWEEAAESTVVEKAQPDYRAQIRDLIRLRPR